MSVASLPLEHRDGGQSRVMRLARVQDRISFGDTQPWEINPRTEFLETRAPLTWTGVRPYVQPDGTTIRVLRRPEQVEAPKHMQRLRTLTATQGHPKDDVNVSPANVDSLSVGATGDEIRIDVIEGYRCPTARVVAKRQSTIDRIRNGATQSSLGYTALWVGPADDELGVDPKTGKRCGVWGGPHGHEYYDLEHILDPDCELVRELVKRTAGTPRPFDPDTLGANHFAIGLDRGRGGVQSELMRVVDSLDLMASIVTDAAPEWTVSTNRDLPFASADVQWDGDAAAASVFAWAGFDTDKPDESKARQAFLVHDANAPTLRGSYKLPIARYADDRLEVVKSGLDAAAGYLPKTDVPQDVRDRARDVLDVYYSRFAEQASAKSAQDSLPTRTPSMTTEAITKHVYTLAPSRDLASWATKYKLAVPQTVVLTVARDEVDVEKLTMLFAGMEELLAAGREMLGAAEVKMEDLGEDKAALEEAVKAKQSELEAAQLALKSATDGMTKTCDEVTKARDALTLERDALLAEVAPLRTAELDRVRSIAVKAGVAKDEADKAKDIPALRRAIVLARCPDDAATFRDADDSVIAGVYQVVSRPFAGSASATSGPTTPKVPTAAMPEPKIVTPRDKIDDQPSAIDAAFNRLGRRPTPA